MNTHVKLGTLWGVPIGLHNSWFLVFGLVTVSLATGYFPLEYPDLPPLAAWTLGGLTGVLFFASVLAHELGHVRVALRERVPVRGITLFMFGGVAQIEDEPRTAGAEFRIAIAGPIVSLLLAALFGALYLLDRSVSPYLAAPSIWLARINLILAVFNMIPGFPLDGGRVLRAVIWQVTGSQIRATRLAAGIGQAFAYGFIGLGVLQMLTGGFFNGLWMVFIGWFLQNAAQSAVMQNRLREQLAGVNVGQIMTRDCVPIPHWVPVKELVEQRMMLRGERCFVVAEGSIVTGVITPDNLITIPRERWATLTAGDIMLRSDQHHTVETSSGVLDALRIMERDNMPQLAVMENGRLLGTVTREQILDLLQMQTQFSQ
jgi:Zn-dependent protease/CBS domain-containing protein